MVSNSCAFATCVTKNIEIIIEHRQSFLPSLSGDICKRIKITNKVIEKYLGTLALEVELSKGQVDDKNSDLFIAGKLAGVCRGCHEELWPGS